MSSSQFVKGTIILTIAAIISKILGSIFRIPLQNIAGDEVLGIFSLVYPVYMVALYLSVAGIPTAISKLIAESRAKQMNYNIPYILTTASILAVIFGIGIFFLLVVFSGPISNALGGPSTKLALVVVSITILIAPYMAVYRGYFQGFENMQPTAISQVIEQFIRASLILIIAYILVKKGYSNEIIAGLIMVGSVIGVLAALLYLIIKYLRTRPTTYVNNKYHFQNFLIWSKSILILSIPIAFGSITMALINLIDSLTIPYALQLYGIDSNDIHYMYGIYSRGLTLAQIVTVFATSIVLPLIPLLTTKYVNKDHTSAKNIIERAHFLIQFISWPTTVGLLTLTLPINLALFSDYNGSSIIAIIGVSSLFTSLTLLGTGILQGINLAKQAAVIVVCATIFKLFSNIYLVQFIGLNGAAISTLLVYVLLFTVNTYYIYKKVPFPVINRKIRRIILSSLIMGVIINIPTIIISFDAMSRLQAAFYVTVTIFVGVFIYLGLLFIQKVIDKETFRTFIQSTKLHKKK